MRLLFKVFVTTYLSLCIFSVTAQKGGIPLADEYFSKSEYEKAIQIYNNFSKDVENALIIYDNYTECLTKLAKYEEKEKFLKKMLKWEPINPRFKVDLMSMYIKSNKKADAEKIFSRLKKDCKENQDLVIPAANFLIKSDFKQEAIQIYTKSRENFYNFNSYQLELATIYKDLNKTKEMLAELMDLIKFHQNDKEYLKGQLQNFIASENEIKLFEEAVISKMQLEPDQIIYLDLIIWIHVQKKDFLKAFLYAKSFDRVTKQKGSKCLELGKLALENQDNEAAIQIFEYVIKNYPSSANYTLARKYKIETKEILVKSMYPVKPLLIESLIADYKQFINEMGTNEQTVDAIRSMAMLYALYTDKKDSAIMYLDKVINSRFAYKYLINKCKIDLGDIYLLKNEPWESTLYYSQVEKAEKDSPLGYEAKLRNARLSYFTGQFELAQDHLNVLKLATHREIANDAMALSVFILENMGTENDSTNQTFQIFASIELLIFQNKYDLALQKLDSIMDNVKNHPLEDEILLLEAQVYQKFGKFETALDKLNKIENLHKTGNLGDDAAFLKVKILDENMHNKEEALKYYANFLIDFPASIYTVEVRKRYRILRGDNL
jgi:tetratricopeptide (TPR) repeat protein